MKKTQIFSICNDDDYDNLAWSISKRDLEKYNIYVYEYRQEFRYDKLMKKVQTRQENLMKNDMLLVSFNPDTCGEWLMCKRCNVMDDNPLINLDAFLGVNVLSKLRIYEFKPVVEMGYDIIRSERSVLP